MKIEIKDLIKIVKDNEVYILFYRDGKIYYGIKYNDNSYQFPVGLDDVGNATLLNKDKATFFMRYIRKAIENEEFVKI